MTDLTLRHRNRLANMGSPYFDGAATSRGYTPPTAPGAGSFLISIAWCARDRLPRPCVAIPTPRTSGSPDAPAAGRSATMPCRATSCASCLAHVRPARLSSKLFLQPEFHGPPPQGWPILLRAPHRAGSDSRSTNGAGPPGKGRPQPLTATGDSHHVFFGYFAQLDINWDHVLLWPMLFFFLIFLKAFLSGLKGGRRRRKSAEQRGLRAMAAPQTAPCPPPFRLKNVYVIDGDTLARG